MWMSIRLEKNNHEPTRPAAQQIEGLSHLQRLACLENDHSKAFLKDLSLNVARPELDKNQRDKRRDLKKWLEKLSKR